MPAEGHGLLWQCVLLGGAERCGEPGAGAVLTQAAPVLCETLKFRGRPTSLDSANVDMYSIGVADRTGLDIIFVDWRRPLEPFGKDLLSSRQEKTLPGMPKYQSQGHLPTQMVGVGLPDAAVGSVQAYKTLKNGLETLTDAPRPGTRIKLSSQHQTVGK